MPATVEPRVPTTVLLSVAAVGAALIAVFGESGAFTALGVASALVGLLPWALVAGGVQLPPAVFAVLGLVPVWVGVVIAENPGGMFPAMLVVTWVTRTSSNAWLVAGTVVAAVGSIVTLALQTGEAHENGMAYFIGGIGISWLCGRMLRRQELLNQDLQAMNELRVEHAAVAERARIARDVHDVVAHSLTVVMLHLTGARRALAADPAQADQALARAELVGRESLDSIRQVMGLLRDPGDGADVPVPGLAELPALIDGYAAGGLDLESDLSSMPMDADTAVGFVVFRIVQESLTNVLRHAPGASCHVSVRAGADAAARHVDVEISNGVATGAGVVDVRAGLGVRGMVERVRALGGRLEAGPVAGGGWMVRATIPLRGVARAPRAMLDGPPTQPPAAPETIEDGWPTPIAR